MLFIVLGFLAAFVGAGSLGRFITSGLALLDNSLLLVGAVPVALLALFVEVSLAGVERLVTPPATSCSTATAR